MIIGVALPNLVTKHSRFDLDSAPVGKRAHSAPGALLDLPYHVSRGLLHLFQVARKFADARWLLTAGVSTNLGISSAIVVPLTPCICFELRPI